MKHSIFVISNMDCPAEEALIRKRLAMMPGIDELTFNLMERRLNVGHTLPDEQSILGALHEIGMKTVPAQLLQPETHTDHKTNEIPPVPNKTWFLIALPGIAAITAEIVAWSSLS